MKLIAVIVVVLALCYTLDAAPPVRCFCPLCTCEPSTPNTASCSKAQTLEDPATDPGIACEDYCHNACLAQCARSPPAAKPGCKCSCPCLPVPCAFCPGSIPSETTNDESASQPPADETTDGVACQCKVVCGKRVACKCPVCNPIGPL